MYRSDESTSLYRAAARNVWERYRPRALELPVGLALLRDPEVDLSAKVRAIGRGVAAVALLFVAQAVVAYLTGLREPITPVPVMVSIALAALAITVPLAMMRLAEPEHVIRVRLRRLEVIPLRRKEP